MKNFFKIALAAALIISMTACGNNVQPENNEVDGNKDDIISEVPEETPENPEPSVSDEQPTEIPDIPEDEPEQPVSSEINPEEPEVSEDVIEEPTVFEFDPLWAGNGYEMSVPQPPYPVNVVLRDGSFIITTSSSDEVLAGSIDDVVNYCNVLQQIGYNINIKSEELKGFTEDRPGYNFFAENSEGRFVEVIYDGNGLMMFVKDDIAEEKPEEDVSAESSAFDTAWASNDYEKLIPQPPFESWEGTMKDSNVYELFTSKANVDDSISYYDVWQNYLDLLKSLDFSVEGEVYSSTAYDPMGNEFKLKCGDGCAWITFYPVN